MNHIPRKSGFRSSAAGFSLIELLVVCALLAMLMGLSVGALSRISQGSVLDSSENLVRAALMRAQASARSRGALASVGFIPSNPRTGATATIESMVVVDAGSWQFEEASGSEVIGGRNRFARIRGGTREEDGFVGRCVALKGGQSVQVEPSVDLDPTRGFMLSLYVRPEAESSGAEVCSFGDSFRLNLAEDGAVQAVLVKEESAEEVLLKTAAGLWEAGTWIELSLGWDGLEATLAVHGQVEARQELTGRLSTPGEQGRLAFGGRSYAGRVDEVLYRTAQPLEPEVLDAGVEFEELKQPLHVRFDSAGRLDPRRHSSGVRITLLMEGEKATIDVDLAGIIR